MPSASRSTRFAGLRQHGAKQIYFKYCSTFDSTAQGNIGPVTEALLDALDARFTIATPAFPDNGRTVFRGHLFVGDALLNESGMQHHPLTPMTDANLVRVLQSQCTRKVGLADYRVVGRGPDAIRARFDELRRDGASIAIVDAVSNDDLMRLGPALKDMALVTAGSGVAIGLPANFGLAPSNAASELPSPAGRRGDRVGSCSTATNRQVHAFVDGGGAAFRIDPLRTDDVVAEALAWADARPRDATLLVYSTASPDEVKSAQERLGAHGAGERLERALAGIARGLVERGVAQLVVAGGETSARAFRRSA
jgi:uncharacterized protein YgbK (DUF1537 family)